MQSYAILSLIILVAAWVVYRKWIRSKKALIYKCNSNNSNQGQQACSTCSKCSACEVRILDLGQISHEQEHK